MYAERRFFKAVNFKLKNSSFDSRARNQVNDIGSLKNFKLKEFYFFRILIEFEHRIKNSKLNYYLVKNMLSFLKNYFSDFE